MEEATIADPKKGFFAQRRSLIIVSLFTFLYETAGISLGRINLFGTELIVRNPNNITWALWIIYVYFLLRYYQYFRDYGDRGIKSSFAHENSRYLCALAWKWAYAKFLARNGGYNKYEIKKQDYLWLHNLKWSKFIRVNGNVFMSKESEGKEGLITEDVSIKHVGIAYAGAKAMLHTAFHTRLVTDFYLPFFIAALPVLAKLKKIV